MSVKVNPPPQVRIPDQFIKDPEIRQFFEQQRQILFQLWKRTGGSEDSVDESEQELTSVGSRVARNAVKINALEKAGFDVEIITSDYTTTRNQIIICNNTGNITVTLDVNAVEEDQVHIKRSGGQVTVVGGIDGKSLIVINVKYYSAHLVFNGTDWSQI